jgi:hypothetical protein
MDKTFTATTKVKTLLESSKDMYKNTLKQVKGKNKGLDKEVKNIYSPKSILPPLFEPKMNNRWRLKFPKKLKIPDWFIKGLTRPVYPFSTNNKITVVLHDPISVSISENLINFLNNQKPFELKLLILDPLGEVVEKWNLGGCLITGIQWSILDYQNNDISSIYLEISYNEVKIKTK